MDARLFRVEKAIDKTVFLDVYRATTEVALLCFAPFGILDDYDNIIAENTSEAYAAEFAQWEELVSRRLFRAHGFGVDRIAASMHEYVETRRDGEVFEVIESAQLQLLQAVSPPAVVELPPAVGAEEVALLLTALVAALRRAFAGISLDDRRDAQAENRYGMTLLRRQLRASDAACSKGCLSSASALELRAVLGGVSALQLHALLDVCAEERAVRAALLGLGLPEGRAGLRMLRAGAAYINLVASPLVSFLAQLDGADRLSVDGADRQAARELCVDALALLARLRRRIEEGRDPDDPDAAALDALADASSAGALPAHLLALLLLARATVRWKQGRAHDALADCDRAVAVDDRLAAALSLRSELCASAEDLAAAAMDALAAFLLTGSTDALLANTAELASRELCRAPAKRVFAERCVLLADSPDEHGSATADGSALPRPWFVRSYLAGYDSLLGAFRLDFAACFAAAAALEADPTEPESDHPGEVGEVPQHLRDLDCASPRALDAPAYSVLCALAFLLDGMHAPQSSVSTSVDEYVAARRLEEEHCVLLPCAEAALASLLSGDCALLSTGLCEEEEWLPAVEGDAHAEASARSLRAVFRLLRAPETEAVTGVRWDAKGHLRSVDVADPYYDIDMDARCEGAPEDYTPAVSPQLLARLMNVCAMLAYICGDTSGAIKCLRYSCYLDRRLVDSVVKLGSLLVDTDELEEAGALLDAAADQDPLNPFVCMHRAELLISLNDFGAAEELLRRARELAATYSSCPGLGDASEALKAIKAARDDFRERELRSNVSSLLAVAQFRGDPEHPESALRSLQHALSVYPSGVNALLCYGEMLSQAGDAVGGILAFRKAAVLDPSNPMPHVNTARTLAQLGQLEQASANIARALELDCDFCMTYVDKAQLLVQRGLTEEALACIELGLAKAKHVSEIRDVLTAQKIATMQRELEKRGLYRQVVQEA